MRSRKRRKQGLQSTLAGLLLGLLAAMVLLSLATHSPLDVARDWDSVARVENASGLVGAYVSGALFKWLGPLGAWVAPLVILLWSANRLRRSDWREPAVRCGVGGLFLVVMLAHVSLWTEGASVGWGGAVGRYVAGLSKEAFGSLGAHLALWAVLLSLTFSISDLPLRIISSLGEHLIGVLAAAWRKVARTPAAASGALRWVASARRGRGRPERTESGGPDIVEPGRALGDENIVGAGMEPTPKVMSAVEPAAEDRVQNEAATRRAPESRRTDSPGRSRVDPAVEPPLGLDPENVTVSAYKLPPLSLLDAPEVVRGGVGEEEVMESSRTLQEALSHFGVKGRVSEVHPGPVITRYDFAPAAGVRVSQIISRQDDIALALRCQNIRIVAPIPGKAAVGIEVPNKSPQVVYLKELLGGSGFRDAAAKLLIALGKTVSGDPHYADLGTMPHLLIAGATGSGKSVCVNSVITSLLYRLTADDLKLLLIDPKRLELSGYNGIPHLLLPVVTDHKRAAKALRWVVMEMDRRYKQLASVGVRDIGSYNQKVAVAAPESGLRKLPFLVIVVDELADLMVALPAEIEEPVTRLAQMARAVGIHLILATQRPSVDVITGLIKANFPSRVAFQVAAKVDSRTILDTNGAECLLGRGDMLFLPGSTPQPVRIHGAFVSGEETARVTEFLKNQVSSEEGDVPEVEVAEDQWDDAAGDEEIFKEAAKLVVMHQQGSTSLLQRRLRIGYSRAARIVDMLEQRGIVGPYNGSKAREVLVDESYLEEHSLL